MKKIKRAVTAALAFAMALVLTACGGSLSGLSVSLDGAYSFQGDGSSSYRIEIYDASQLSGDTIPQGVYPLVRYNVDGGSGQLSGTVTVRDSAAGVDIALADSLPFGSFVPYVVSLKDGKTVSSAAGGAFTKSGALTAPEISAAKATDSKGGNWAVKVTLATAGLDNYRTKQALSSYVIEVYDNQACTGTPVASTTLDAVSYEMGGYSNNTWTVDVPEGTQGVAFTYFVRAMANANDGVGAQASGWCEPVSVDVDGEAGGSSPGGPGGPG